MKLTIFFRDQKQNIILFLD